MEDPRGRSVLRLEFLMLRPSPFSENVFVRIGIGFVETKPVIKKDLQLYISCKLKYWKDIVLYNCNV